MSHHSPEGKSGANTSKPPQSEHQPHNARSNESLDIEEWLNNISISKPGDHKDECTWEPKTFNKDDKFLFCKADSDELRRAPMETSEKKLVQVAFQDYVLGQLRPNFEPFAIFGKNRFLAKSKPGLRNDLAKVKLSAVVTLWLGSCYPPENIQSLTSDLWNQDFGPPLNQDSVKYMKAWWKKGKGTQRGWRWLKVELYDHSQPLAERIQKIQVEVKNEGLEREALNGLDAKGDKPIFDVRLHHVFMSLDIKEFGSKDLFTKAGVIDGQINEMVWKEVTVALLTKEFNGRPEVATHATRFFDLKKDQTKNLRGLSLCTGHDRRIAMDSNEKLVLYSAPCAKFFFKPRGTIAEFIEGCFGQGSWNSDEELLMLNKVLRTKKVCFRTNKGWQQRAVGSVHPSTPATAREDDKHKFWRANINIDTSKFSHLPCINVGTSSNHEFLPAELCHFADEAQSYTGPRLGVSLKVLQDRRDGMERTGRPGQAAYEIRIRKPEKTLRRVKLDVLIKEAFRDNMRVGFIEAGVDSVHSPEWTTLRRKLGQILKDMTSVNVTNINPLFLQYTEDKNNKDEWSGQLSRWKELNKAGSEKVLAIVLVHNDKHHSAIYNLLKGLGDTSIGIQTYFLRTKVLEDKGFQDSSMGMAAFGVIRRIGSRNLRGLKYHEGILDIAIAVHVERVTIKEPDCYDETGNLKTKYDARYLIVLSSRHVGHGRDYKTTQSSLSESKYFDEHGVAESAELSVVTKSILGQSARVSYVFLVDNDLLKIPAREKNAYDHNSPDDGNTITIAEMRKAGDFRAAQLFRRSNTRGPVTGFNVYLLGDTLAFVPPTEQAENRESPKEPKLVELAKSLSVTTALADAGEHDSGYSSQAHSSKSTSPTDSRHSIPHTAEEIISRSEMIRLAALWMDESLDLYDTTFPIPVHLAHLAAKRAQKQIVQPVWDQQTRAFSPPKLQSVHEDIMDTLYFL